jgi:simple sugar transport system ATP-binding protein
MTSGTLEVKGKDITHADILTRRSLIAFVPQDRGKMGASVAASILEDAIMTHHILDPRFSTWRGLGLDYRQAAEFVDQIRDQFAVSMGHSSDAFSSLSGGNQQKVILGRELLLDTPFVLMDQPTRGLDVGSIEYVHQLILDLRSRERAVLLVSADLDELFMVADHIVVMCQGEVVADLATDETTREEVGYYMLGGKEAAHAETGS